MKRAYVVFAAIAVIGAGIYFTRAPAAKVEAPFDGEPELIAATFSSAFCPPCRILKPRLAKAMPAFRSASVKFVDYDLTFGETEKVRSKAAADGLGAVVDRYSKAMGYTLLIDADTGEVISILTIDYSSKAMRAEIEKALAVARANTPETR